MGDVFFVKRFSLYKGKSLITIWVDYYKEDEAVAYCSGESQEEISNG